MITWTSAGAVERPVMLQIRVQRAYPGRIRAGAPVPTRSMSSDEILANLRFFTLGMDKPRTRPCTRLVLSGVGAAGRAETPELIRAGRRWGITNVVLHVGGEDLEGFEPGRYADLVDALVVPVQPGPSGGALGAAGRVLRACSEQGIAVVANTVLSPHGLRDLVPAARAIAASGAKRAAFTYPFPIGGNTSAHVPPVAAAVAGLQRAVAILERAGVSADIKGLPACYLGDLARLLRRSANRWYVDADHQLDDAVLFFPDVVAFTKSEACRFCALDAQCDGFFATYLRRAGFPALDPVSADSA